MLKEKKEKYQPAVCDHCGLQTTYPLAVDRGTALIVKALSVAIRNKGINIVHPRKEMEVSRKDWSFARCINEGKVTSSMICNFIRPKTHGLIAPVKGEAGNWCLTKKGLAFLQGEPILKYVIARKTSKKTGRSHNGGYWGTEMVTIDQFNKGGDFWEPIGYTIQEGRVVHDLPVKPKTATLL